MQWYLLVISLYIRSTMRLTVIAIHRSIHIAHGNRIGETSMAGHLEIMQFPSPQSVYIVQCALGLHWNMCSSYSDTL